MEKDRIEVKQLNQKESRFKLRRRENGDWITKDRETDKEKTHSNKYSKKEMDNLLNNSEKCGLEL